MKTNLALSLGVLLALTTAFAGSAQAQTREIPCGTDEYFQQKANTNPVYRQTQQEMENAMLSKPKFRETAAADTVTYTIPVVFHIVSDGGAEDISKTKILYQMKTLNEAFNRQNADTVNIRAPFKSLVSNAHIRFVLASKDPWGNCTDGIDRVTSSQTANAGDNIKSVAWWNNKNYLNVWVVRSIQQPSGLAGIIAGYSTFPWDAVNSPSTDGIIVNYQFVGSGQKTLPHEVGHYLGLYHTFQDGCSEDQQLQGDRISDTPPVAQASFGWNPTANSCSTDKPDQLDMLENYMDYSDRKLLFTPLQVARMRSYLTGYRSHLVSSANLALVLAECNLTGVEEPKPTQTSLSVYPNPATDRVELHIVSNKAQNCNISLIDMQGRVIYATTQETVSNGETVIAIDLAGLNTAPGIYLLNVNTPEKLLQQKIYIQH